MGIKFNSDLRTILSSTNSKSNWSANLKSALGSNRQIVCTKDGVEFYRANISGTLGISNNKITDFGIVGTVTTQAAADLSTGSCFLRIEGNQQWIEGTLGLPGSGADFIISSNPTATSGLGFLSTASLSGGDYLPPVAQPSVKDIIVHFGAQGASAPITIKSQLYSGLSIGFGSTTQSRWASEPITVNGIDFVVYPGIDSDGRADCWIYAPFAIAANTTDTARNRERAAVELQITIDGNSQNLFGQGTTFSYTHQRTTWLRWQSSTLPWDTSTTYINNLVSQGVFLKHDSRNVIGSLENTSSTNLPNVVGYVPFSTFADISQTTKVGDQSRSSPAGGERTSIGPVHEWFARLISEVGTNNNPSWLTADKLQILKDLAETAAQFPMASGLVENDILIDPSVKPYCTHDNPNAWAPCFGVPQPGTYGADHGLSAEMPFDGRYDHAHPYNKFSFHAWNLSKDPWHLFLTQAQAIAVLSFNTGFDSARGVDGKISRITVQEERGFWWSLQCLIHAWYATPSGTMPAPFRSKAFFATAIDNSLQWIRDRIIGTTTPYYTGVEGEATRFWRTVGPFYINTNEFSMSAFMCDYGHIVCCEALLLGYSNLRDVAEWHAVNAQYRAQMGGNWYLNDPYTASQGLLAEALAIQTDPTLAYSTTDQFKAWYPRQTSYKTGTLSSTDWTVDYGRDTYMWFGVLSLYKEAVSKGVITIGFDPATELTNALARHPGPYTTDGTVNTLPLNYTIWAKQYFSY